ncbi:hypothetical protein [Nesterenkonia alkaliphila]|uniref:Uncharacterized protein n=1 Tax=Nesterenkonia alkaliphila TaxID=1463631 RepID=A0A7K1UJV7_9MICC|nr:hypothetical protein [Nesterenkonia alkaliphila]MVT26311.1 hypothetical protein [Nesterenkonia alkaliphila]GFZ88277.1 hypothetical protein GCM10011359_16950 [Nesterenkonia alkaliphila]
MTAEATARSAAQALAVHLDALAQPERSQAPLSDSQLLARALAARGIRAKRITEGRWVFEFRGNVIGGFANRVTTLVSAHSRRVLRDPAQLIAHLDLMEVPHALEYDDAEDQFQPPLPIEIDLTQDRDKEAVLVQAYCVGKRAVSVITAVPNPEGGKSLTVDLTGRVAEEIFQLAVDGLRAVPGLLAGAVTLRVSSLDSVEGGVVLGIDETASIVPHHYPDRGQGQPVADALAEHILFTAAL